VIIALISIAIICWIFYFLFIKGNAWPILLIIFGITGGSYYIKQYFPDSCQTIITFMSYEISWATFIATIITILGVGFIMEK